jgi:hypothetical protein
MARMPNRSDLEAALDAAVELGKAQAKALAALPGAITAIAEAAQNINATANEARAVIRKAQAVTDRLDAMLDHVEPAVGEITPTLQALKEAQQRIVAMTGSTEKMASFVEDAGAGLSKLAGISGATGLFSRIAAATKPADPAAAAPRTLAAVRAELVATDDHDHQGADEPPEEFLAELVETPVPATHVDEGIEDADLVEPVPLTAVEEGVEDAGLVEPVPPTAEAEGMNVAPQGEVRVSEAEVDAALQPVELGSEADGPDEVADQA